MDKKKAFLNVASATVSRILLLFAALIVRRLLIRHIGNDVNGLNSLYTSIIGMLAVAELGVGSAISFSMYKPIVDGDERRVAGLYFLYRKLYMIIGAVIFAGGLLVLPFLPSLIGDYESLSVNVYVTFSLTLISVVLTYFYGAKTSLIEAHKYNYITTVISTLSRLITYGLQIAAILLWKSFVAYLICQIIGTLITWALTEAFAKRRYQEIINTYIPVDDDTKPEVVKNIKAMFMHNIGNILVNTIDNVIISAFIGVVILGKYSNYVYICSVMAGTISLFFSPLTSTVGHLCAQGNKEKTKGYFDYFYSLNYFLGVIFFLGYFAVVHSVVGLIFGPGLEVSQGIVFVITVSQFINFMRKACMLFRNASGTFYNDRWKPVFEGICNLVLSLAFVHIFPEEYKVVGVIVATIITNLAICYIVEPFVLFKYAFEKSPREYYIRNYCYTGVFVIALYILSRCVGDGRDPAAGIVVNGFISVAVSIGVLLLVATVDKRFRDEIMNVGKKVLARNEK